MCIQQSFLFCLKLLGGLSLELASHGWSPDFHTRIVKTDVACDARDQTHFATVDTVSWFLCCVHVVYTQDMHTRSVEGPIALETYPKHMFFLKRPKTKW